ncbi:MAG: hypothetical protein ACXVZO_11555 [Gaiellaceae bacterium]
MRVCVTDPRLVEAFIAFLEERGCLVEELANDVLEVIPLGSFRHDLADVALAPHLELWLEWHPRSVVEVLGN